MLFPFPSIIMLYSNFFSSAFPSNNVTIQFSCPSNRTTSPYSDTNMRSGQILYVAPLFDLYTHLLVVRQNTASNFEINKWVQLYDPKVNELTEKLMKCQLLFTLNRRVMFFSLKFLKNHLK